MVEIKGSEMLGYLGSIVALITVAQTMMHTLLPAPLRDLVKRLFARLMENLTRYHYVEVPEYDESCLCNELYGAIKLHLSANVLSYANTAKRVKLCRGSNSSGFTWSPARNQKVPLTFQGASVRWEHQVSTPQAAQQSNFWSRSMPDEKRTYTLRVHKRDKARVVGPYMEHILDEAKAIKHSNRERLLYTNSKGDFYRHPWDSVPFKHPSTFETLAMDPQRKTQIQADLQAFSRGETFYKKTGRAWKRGYLLHGPPGTGKSSLIAAMANLLRYDVYDLELTQVRSNGDLKKLLLRTTSKSIIVIEDIDCSLDLGNRGKRSSSRKSEHKTEENGSKGGLDESVQASSSMTLSGLLNFTDGLWSCCGEERIFVFTTNHIENLDPALLRSGRMDMHILMSFCTFRAFEILVMNYLGMEDHHLFAKVRDIIDDAHITPAEVSEVLIRNREEPDTAMEKLLESLEIAKAKPWPPLTSKEVEATVPVVEGDVEEVKRAVAVPENQLMHDSIEKASIRCSLCKAKCEERLETEEKKTSAEHGVDDGGLCIDKEMSQKIKKLQKAD